VPSRSLRRTIFGFVRGVFRHRRPNFRAASSRRDVAGDFAIPSVSISAAEQIDAVGVDNPHEPTIHDDGLHMVAAAGPHMISRAMVLLCADVQRDCSQIPEFVSHVLEARAFH